MLYIHNHITYITLLTIFIRFLQYVIDEVCEQCVHISYFSLKQNTDTCNLKGDLFGSQCQKVQVVGFRAEIP